MKNGCLVILALFFLINSVFSQEFKINIENEPSTFLKQNPKLFIYENDFILATWTDYREGDPKVYAQFLNQLFQPVRKNFSIYGNDQIIYLQDSVWVATKLTDYQGDYDMGYSVLTGKIYHDEKPISSEIDFDIFPWPWCGTGFTGYDYQIVPFSDSFLYFGRYDSYLQSKRYDLSGNLIGEPQNYLFKPAYLTASSFEDESYILIFLNDAMKDNSEKSTGIFFTLFNAQDSIVLEKQLIKDLNNYLNYDYPFHSYFEIRLNSIPLNDTTLFVSFWEPDSGRLNYFRIKSSGEADSVRFIEMPSVTSTSNCSLSIRRGNDKSILILTSMLDWNGDATKVFKNYFYYFSESGEFSGKFEIDSTMGRSLGEDNLIYLAPGDFYLLNISNEDVYFTHYRNFNAVDSLKLNDDERGSNESVQTVIPRNDRFFVVYLDETGYWGRWVTNNGIPKGEEIKLTGWRYNFFPDNSVLQVWYNPYATGYSIYDPDFNLQFSDTLFFSDYYHSVKAAAKIVSDTSFIFAYSDNRNIKIHKFSRSGRLLNSVETTAEAYIRNLRIFQTSDDAFWLTWYNFAQKFSYELKPLSAVKEFDNEIKLVFDPQVFLLTREKGFLEGAIVSLTGDTLFGSLQLTPYCEQTGDPVQLSENAFLVPFIKDGDLMANSFNLSGEVLNENVLISQETEANKKNPLVMPYGNLLFFAWDELSTEGDGYDVMGRILPVKNFTEVSSYRQRAMSFKLKQNYPNPFNPQTTIYYEITKTDFVELSVYNLLGQKIRTLVREKQSPGEHQIIWDGRNDRGAPVVSGVYLYRLKTGEGLITKKMILVR